MITREEAVRLSHGQEIYHLTETNADGTPRRYRVNGRFHQQGGRFSTVWRLPLKRGLNEHYALTPQNAHEFTINKEEANAKSREA